MKICIEGSLHITAQPKSNTDRIRQMTDEKLVKSIRLACKHCTCYDAVYGVCVEPDKDCEKGNLEWLKQEVSEDERGEE